MSEMTKLQEHLEKLKKELKTTKRDSDRWLKLLEEIDELESQLENMQDSFTMFTDTDY